MLILHRGIQQYELIWEEMKHFTASRTTETTDQVWMLQHFPVYTQGQAGKVEHILNPGKIPIVQSDRGGQVTYHGPGQLLIYVLFDIKRRKLGIRSLVCCLQDLLIQSLATFNIHGHTQCGAPGVYVDDKKIASIGLRVKNGCTYHGLALNVEMDLTPFLGINPCGYTELKMTHMKNLVPNISFATVEKQLSALFFTEFGR